MKLETKNTTRLLALLAAAMLALLPFHAFLTVWASSMIGHYTLLRLWKEIVLLVLLVGCAGLIGLRLRTPGGRAAFRRAWRRPLVVVISIYCALLVGAGLAALASGTVSPKALGYGLLLDGRYLAFFGIVWLLCSGSDWIGQHWRRLLLIPAAIVIVFGLLQFTLLPNDFLAHFGYGPATISAVQTVDQKDAYQRVQSTLRGANPLGAYLVLVLAALGALLLQPRLAGTAAAAKPTTAAVNTSRRRQYAGLFAAGCVVLALTFSRSAWLGALAALGYLLLTTLTSARARRLLLVAGAAGLLGLAATGYLLRSNDVVQNTLFHTDEHSQAATSSNAGHFQATAVGLGDIAQRPLGSGTGTAGPASVYNTGQGKGGPRIAENYFVQIGQEVGVVGLGLFVAVNGLLAYSLWQRRGHLLARALLASLIGITLINLLSHAWADDTLAYVWWGLAGAALALPLTKPAETSNGSSQPSV